MQGDATELGIHPPHTVRVTMDGPNGEDWAHNWPHESIIVEPDAITVADPHYGNRIVRYPYVHATQHPDGGWEFTGEEDDFTIKPGPVTPPSMDTNGPAGEDWPEWDPDE